MNMLLASAIIEATWVAQTILVGKPLTAPLGWVIGIVNMLLWILFGVLTGGYFFAVCAVAGIAMYVRNYVLAENALRSEQ